MSTVKKLIHLFFIIPNIRLKIKKVNVKKHLNILLRLL